MYKIVGRFVGEEDKDKTLNYYLVNNSGDKMKASIKYTTDLASKGLISNAKVQIKRDGQVLLRGNLVNLSRLPVMSNSITGLKIVGDSKIVGKIIRKDKIAGYVVESAGGNLSKLSYKKVVTLTSGNYIGNAELTRNKNNEVIVNVKDKNLEEYYMDRENRIYKKGSSDVKFRAVKQSSGGIINGEPFDKGDYVLCGYKGKISIVKQKEFDSDYIEVDSNFAICDLYIEDIELNIERFDTSIEKVLPSEIESWLVFKRKI
jgi:hypothetical protein